MGIVAKQSFYNILSVILAFAIGALNTIVFYPRAMGEELYGIVLILPCTVQHIATYFFLWCATHRHQVFFGRFLKERAR